MQADVRTFKAPTLEACLELVHRDLGPDAVVLHTRQSTKRGLLPWSRTREEVEITAGTGLSQHKSQSRPSATVARLAAAPAPARFETADAVLQPPPNLLGQSAAERAPLRAATASVNRLPVHPTPVRPEVQIPEEAGERRTGSQTIAARLAAIAAGAPPTTAAQAVPSVTPPAPAVMAPKPASTLPPLRERAAAPAATPAPAVSKPATPVVATARYVPSSDPTLAIQQRLDMLQKMLSDLGRQSRNRGVEDIPAELFSSFTQLIDAEVDEEVARDVILRLRNMLQPAQRQDPAAVQAVLTALIEKELRIGPVITPQRGRRKVVALVGPTGVGKTTTIAKLAANFRLRDGARLGLITVDTYRVAAVEQLRTYAEIMDLPMKVVTSPQEMRRALDELTGLDLVLIDTAGRSPKDELKLQELKSVLAEACPDEVHLVMSLAAGSRLLQATAAQFQPAGVTSLILTKLDEASGPGSLLNIARSVPVPVSYLTTGQDVPTDIEPAHASRMARLVTGQETLTESALR